MSRVLPCCVLCEASYMHVIMRASQPHCAHFEMREWAQWGGGGGLAQGLWLQVAGLGCDPRAVWDCAALTARQHPGEAGEAEATSSPAQPSLAQLIGSN